ncbi:hypothetical protein bsdtw1_04800 [Clostridium fungisolvens]|uniref:Uncharacterized protein n=2 Tax=Clostridium fungisolvens TaxID=1604897 RepID=A0A6V8SUL0_9CLOT|nr:hypothetical protein bsdtw1_04800 [Clostridium fungisolvens]
MLWNRGHKLMKIVRYDLAIDYPILRSSCHLLKDNRKYCDIRNSLEDRTEYLGTRSHHGRVKLYNKMIESNLDYPLTRLELTIDADLNCYDEIKRIFPTVYVIDDLQLCFDTEKLTGTDKVLFFSCLDNMDYLSMLSRKKKEKIVKMMSTYFTTFQFNEQQYNVITNELLNYYSMLN